MSCSKFLESSPSDCGAWAQFAALEAAVGETDRSRAVYELAIRQPVLDMPETLWKAYIDFEVRACRGCERRFEMRGGWGGGGSVPV